MQYGICHLSIVPVRGTADESAEMVTQILYGEHYKVLEQRKQWSKIRLALDGCEGWVSNNQLTLIEKEAYSQLESSQNRKHSSELISSAEYQNNRLTPIVLGSTLPDYKILNHRFEGNFINGDSEKKNLVKTALFYLNAPYLWGGRNPFGIDASGLTQMVYKINGVALKRAADQQALQGDSLSFIEESEPGDLAFFDDNEGKIHHVGIIMGDNYIIHSYGKVRIDRIDHTGIFDSETRLYTHKLRVIKKII